MVTVTDLADEMTRARCAHVPAADLRVARFRLGVEPEHVAGPPVGVIVGEMPPAAMGTCLPMFPFPPQSAGGRLLAMSGLSPGEYLGKFHRRNLFDAYETWSAPRARVRADLVRAFLRELGGSWRVLLLGARVGRAFMETCPVVPDLPRPEFTGSLWQRWTERWMTRATVDAGAIGDLHEYALIPHPSGLSRQYNAPKARAGAQAAVLWAADMIPTTAVG